MTPDPAQEREPAQLTDTGQAPDAKAPPSALTPKPAVARRPRASRAKGFVPEPTKETNGRTPAGKLGVVAGMLRRPEGATVAQMGEATGWQAHSVRGAIAGSLKKKHGLTIVTQAAEGGRVYRIVEPAA